MYMYLEETSVGQRSELGGVSVHQKRNHLLKTRPLPVHHVSATCRGQTSNAPSHHRPEHVCMDTNTKNYSNLVMNHAHQQRKSCSTVFPTVYLKQDGPLGLTLG